MIILDNRMLHLHLKGEYFDQINNGTKLEEYRLYNEYWKRRLLGRTYEGIVIKRGYPKRSDISKIIQRAWRGYEVQMICHPHFGTNPVTVFAIKVNDGRGKEGG